MFEYARDERMRRIRVTAMGELDTGHFAAILRRQIDEQTWHYAMLYDFRRLTDAIQLDLDAPVITSVFRSLIAFGERGPVAVVSTTAVVTDWLQSYRKQAVRAGMRMEVFSDLADAEAWLTQVQSRAR